jgi:glycosyltransferase involved in cell wall biosynthesis
MPTYVLITPARNEEAYIERTIKAVVAQTALPRKWIIVSDGSTDRTDGIVKQYLPEHPWIELIRMPERRDRHFAAKVTCFNAGYEVVKNAEYDIVCSLDADITFEPDYFEFLLRKFADTPHLGVAGTPFVEGSSHYDYRFTNIEHVSGACQLFRRECFEEIGGYIPIKGGGIDWTAVTMARMKGWKTRTYTEKTCLHLRGIGTGSSGRLMTWFKQGRKDYFLGGHPLWQACRFCYQVTKKPYLIGGSLLLSGYLWAMIKNEERPIPVELIIFHRREQMKRLKKLFSRRNAAIA